VKNGETIKSESTSLNRWDNLVGTSLYENIRGLRRNAVSYPYAAGFNNHIFAGSKIRKYWFGRKARS
jgi:hypothetical protein